MAACDTHHYLASASSQISCSGPAEAAGEPFKLPRTDFPGCRSKSSLQAEPRVRSGHNDTPPIRRQKVGCRQLSSGLLSKKVECGSAVARIRRCQDSIERTNPAEKAPPDCEQDSSRSLRVRKGSQKVAESPRERGTGSSHGTGVVLAEPSKKPPVAQ